MLDLAAKTERVAKLVTPAVKREAFVPMRSLLGRSERRECRIGGADRKKVRSRAQRIPDGSRAMGCRIWRMQVDVSAIGVSSCSCRAREKPRGSTGSTGCIAMTG